jgi:hypothetical protein
MLQIIQNAGREFQRELNNGSLNEHELNWARTLLLEMLKAVNGRLGQKDAHMVPDENIKQLEQDAEHVVTEIQELEK